MGQEAAFLIHFMRLMAITRVMFQKGRRRQERRGHVDGLVRESALLTNIDLFNKAFI